MDTQKQQIVQRLQQANNILVTVSNNPSVDQLAACLGLTLALNKMDKHAIAVFSGQVPSTLEFLQPEETIEKNTDSLRDFIISLDKSKADKLRYKVEDKVVKIFITPYKTSISQKDLEFTQGDLNVDVIVALGVHNQADLDQAITAHGRILHDAAVITVNIKPGGELGTINWLDQQASSLSELASELVQAIDVKLLDGQMATSFLTGIVAETERFSNAKTMPRTMSVSATLMSAGANQQLVATKLQEPKPQPATPPAEPPKEAAPIATTPAQPAQPAAILAQPVAPKKEEPGALEIEHTHDAPQIDLNAATDQQEPKEPQTPKIDIDREGTLRRLEEVQAAQAAAAPAGEATPGRHTILHPPTLDGQMNASFGAADNSFADPLAAPNHNGMLLERPSGAPPLKPTPDISGGSPLAQTGYTLSPPSSAPANFSPSAPTGTLPPVAPLPPITSGLDDARSAVHQAVSTAPPRLEPIAALNAQPVDLNLRDQPNTATPPTAPALPPAGTPQPMDPNAPPPVPPPMLPPVQP